MTKEERAARDWVRLYTSADTIYAAHARTILALLDRPVMPRPEDVPQEVLDRMEVAYWDTQPGSGFDDVRAAIKVLHDWATKREPVKVEAWAVLWPSGTLENFVASRESAERLASSLSQPGRIVHLVEATDD